MIRAELATARSRKGAILLQVSFLMLVVMGLAAVIIDLGMARATQGFMQASVDAASLEGLRQRDVLPDPTQSDENRREAASRFAGLVFDEDLNEGTPANAYLLGAGPAFETGVGGVNDPAGGQLVSNLPYIPFLQGNAAGNEAHGDLVAGVYEALDPITPGNPHWHAEDGLYQRADFAPSLPGDAPTAPAFLARLRRTNDLLGLDDQLGVSSRGPALPYLFGLGSGVLSTDDPDVYDPRRDGITIRATAISDARVVLAAGLSTDQVLGVVPVGIDLLAPTTIPITRILAFDDASWRLLAPGLPFAITVGNDAVVSGTISGLAQNTSGLVRVGDTAGAVATPNSVQVTADAVPLVGTGYVALFDSFPAGARIVGFGAVRIDAASLGFDGGGNTVLELSGVKLPNLVAPENASAQPSLATDLTFLAAPDPARASLLAPVLVR